MGELAQAGATATVRHAGQAEIDAIGEDHGQQCIAVLGRAARSPVGETVAEPGPRIDIEQDVRDLHAGKTIIGIAACDLGCGRGDRLQRRYHQAAFVEPDLRQFALPGERRYAFDRAIQSLATIPDMTIEPGFDREGKRSFLSQGSKSGGRNEVAVEVPELPAARHPDITGSQSVAKLRQRAEFIGGTIDNTIAYHEGPPACRHEAQRHLVGQASLSGQVKIGDDGERIEDSLHRPGTAKRERPQELSGEQLHGAMPFDQLGRAIDRLGTDEDFCLGNSGAEPFPVERTDPRKGIDALGVRVDQHPAAIGQGTQMFLHLAHRPDRLRASGFPRGAPCCRATCRTS